MRRPLRSYLTPIIAILFTLGILTYAYFRTNDLLAGPVVVISSPENGSTLAEPYVEIVGHAKNISYMSLNGRQIFTDEAGDFNEKLLVPYGYTIMTLKARDRFGRSTTKSLELVYQ